MSSTRPAQRGYGGGGPDVLDAHTPVAQRHTQHRTTAQRAGLHRIAHTAHKKGMRKINLLVNMGTYITMNGKGEEQEVLESRLNIHTWAKANSSSQKRVEMTLANSTGVY